MAVSTPEQVLEIVAGVDGGTSLERGRAIYDFVREHGFSECLELGFAHGSTSVWIGAALQANGAGRLTCVDILSAHDRKPSARELLGRAGLTDRVTLVFEESSYTMFLQRTLRQQLREHRIEPLYDFVFLDGAHLWGPDALALLTVDRMLKPGGWVLLDDLEWRPEVDPAHGVTEYEANLDAVKEIWDLLIAPDSSYDELITDGSWGWARKSLSPTPAVRTVVKRDLVGSVRQVAQMARAKLRN